MNAGLALFGLGTVGGGLVEILRARPDAAAITLRHVIVRDPARPRDVSVPPDRLHADPDAALDDPAVSVVVEAIGGLEPAGTIVRTALASGRDVVTANKALVASDGERLERLARENGARLRYEAAVGAAIPIVHALRGALVANRITRIRGILNGTSNYILTRMAEDGLALDEALRTARELGFAEADAAADLSGLDAAQKLVILARHAFGRWRPVDRVDRRGIEAVTAGDIDDALRRDERIKLVADATISEDGDASLRVGPVAVPADDPLARIRHETNAVELDTDFAGPLLWTGAGAGARPTASAVFADLVEVVRARAGQGKGPT